MSVVSIDYNRWIQRFRRKNKENVAYFRCIELHRDSYPHFHVLLQFPSASLRVHNGRWFDSILYRHWRNTWTNGHSDYAVPRATSVGQLTYIMKYLSKNASTKTVWKKIFLSQNQSVPSVAERKSSVLPSGLLQNPTKSVSSVYLSTLKSRIKLLTWSRNFDFTPFLVKTKKIALS